MIDAVIAEKDWKMLYVSEDADEMHSYTNSETVWVQMTEIKRAKGTAKNKIEMRI
jgi:hypothetical protein